SHRRRQIFRADSDAMRFQRTVAIFGRADDKYPRVRLELGAVAGLQRNDLGAGRDLDNLRAAFVVDGDGIAFDLVDLVVGDTAGASAHRSVGHAAFRFEIPGARAFAGATHRFRKDVNLDRLQRAVGPRRRRSADVASRLDVGKARFGDRDDGRIVGQADGGRAAIGLFDVDGIAANVGDRAPQVDWRGS